MPPLGENYTWGQPSGPGCVQDNETGVQLGYYGPDLDGLPHHFAQGPGDVVRIGRNRWRIRWILGDTGGVPRGRVLRALYRAINDPRGWESIGVQIVRTMRPELAQFEIALVPETACHPSAAGCYSVRGGQLPGLELAARYLDTPLWPLLVTHELGHAVFSMHDMYTPWHQPYRGVMGTPMDATAVGNHPSLEERESAWEYLHGRARHVHQH